MYLFCKVDGYWSYRNIDINSYINSYMDTLEKAELIASVCHVARFLKSGVPIYNSEVLDTAGRKTRRRSEDRQLQSVFHFTQTLERRGLSAV